MQFMDWGLEEFMKPFIQHHMKRLRMDKGLTCKYANNLIMYLLSTFTYNELWEGADKSFDNNSLSFF